MSVARLYIKSSIVVVCCLLQHYPMIALFIEGMVLHGGKVLVPAMVVDMDVFVIIRIIKSMLGYVCRFRMIAPIMKLNIKACFASSGALQDSPAT